MRVGLVQKVCVEAVGWGDINRWGTSMVPHLFCVLSLQHECAVALKCQSHHRKDYFLLFCSQNRRVSGASSSSLCWDWEGSQSWKRLSWVRHFSTGNGARDSSSITLWRSIRKVFLFPREFSLKDWESELVTHCLMVSAVRGEGLRFSLQPAGQFDLSAHFPGVGENSPELHPQVSCCNPEPRGGACGGSRA